MSEQTIADKATLDFFSNPLYMSLLKQRQQVTNDDSYQNEVKFYRKRIISLFKDIIKGEGDEGNRELRDIHHKFVMNAIKYFQMTDKKDFIQNQHHTLTGDGDNLDMPLTGDGDGDDFDISGNDLTLDEANEHMMRKTINVASLDNYVIMKKDGSNNDLRIIPIKIEMDLKDPVLKTKGIKKKMKKIE